MDEEYISILKTDLTLEEQKEIIQNELNSLDDVLPRSVEDTWTALGLDTTKLPRVVQDRLNRKIELRNQFKTLTS